MDDEIRVALAAVPVPTKAVIVRCFPFLLSHPTRPFTVRLSHCPSLLALSKRTAQIWFQNARARMKKKPCATSSSPPTYATLMKNSLNLVDSLHLSAGKQSNGFLMAHFVSFFRQDKHLDAKSNQHLHPNAHMQWSSAQTSPASSMIYDGENSNDEYSTGYM